MTMSRIFSALGSALGMVGLVSVLIDCKVDLCDRYPSDPSCVADLGQQAQLQVSPRRIPLQVTPAMINLTLPSDPGTPQKITLTQNGKTIDLGTLNTATSTISPNLRAQVLPGPAMIQVGTQQVAVRLYVPPVFTGAVIQRPVGADLGGPQMQPASPTALGVTQTGKLVMLGQYGPPAVHAPRSYFLNGPMIDPVIAPNLTSYSGSRYANVVSGFAVTSAHIYFPASFNDVLTPTVIRQIDVISASQLQEKYFPFTVISLLTAENSGQLIVARTVDINNVKKLTMFSDFDLSIDANATIEPQPDSDAMTLVGVGEISGDNNADLAIWDATGNVKVYLGTDIRQIKLQYNAAYSTNLTAASKLLGSLPAAVSIGDLDGDLVSDIALVSATGNIALVLNELDGNFGLPINIPTPAGFTGPSALAIGNVNTDPVLQSNDLVIANNDASAKLIGVLVNQATKSWPN